jgi:hypothetical protein
MISSIIYFARELQAKNEKRRRENKIGIKYVG